MSKITRVNSTSENFIVLDVETEYRTFGYENDGEYSKSTSFIKISKQNAEFLLKELNKLLNNKKETVFWEYYVKYRKPHKKCYNNIGSLLNALQYHNYDKKHPNNDWRNGTYLENRTNLNKLTVTINGVTKEIKLPYKFKDSNELKEFILNESRIT